MGPSGERRGRGHADHRRVRGRGSSAQAPEENRAVRGDKACFLVPRRLRSGFPLGGSCDGDEPNTPRAEVLCLLNAGTCVQETLRLARSMASKPRPKWDFFSGGKPWPQNSQGVAFSQGFATWLSQTTIYVTKSPHQTATPKGHLPACRRSAVCWDAAMRAGLGSRRRRWRIRGIITLVEEAILVGWTSASTSHARHTSAHTTRSM